MGNSQNEASSSEIANLKHGPNTVKTSIEMKSVCGLTCGLSYMQGWRPEMEASVDV